MRIISIFKSSKSRQTFSLKNRAKIFTTFHSRAICLLTVMSALTLPDHAAAIVKESGMGSIGVAYPQSSIAARYNPATVAEIGNRFDIIVGAQIGARGHVKISGSTDPLLNQSASTQQCKHFPAYLFGLVKQITPKIAVSTSGDFGIATSSCSIGHTLHPFGHGPFSTSNLIGIQDFTLAYKFNDCHSFGVTMPIYLARLKINGLQNAAFNSLHPNHVSNKGYNWAFGVGIKAGWFYRVTKNLNFGIAYSSCCLASSSFGKYKGALPSKGNLQNPADLWTGIAYDYGQGVVGFQVHCFFFSQLNITHNPVNSTAPGGSRRAPGSGFNDVYVWEVGADYNVSCNLKVRGGFEYTSPTFVSRRNITGDFTLPNLISLHKLASLGATYKFKNFEFNFAYLLSFKRVIKGPPTDAFAGGHVEASGGPNNSFLFGIEKKF